MTRPIVIIGSNSFSGASLTANLLNRGETVVGVSRSKEVKGPFMVYGKEALERFSFFQLSLETSPEAVADMIYELDAKFVFNFAAQSMVAESWNEPSRWYRTNVESLSRLISRLIALKCNLEKFVQFSTPEVYGSTPDWIRENFFFKPSTPYAISRAAGDWHLKLIGENYGFPVLFTRAANVYGPGQQLYRIIPKTIMKILKGEKVHLHGGGKSTRSFIHIEDVSNALWMLMNKGEVGKSYHISNEKVISIRNLVEKIHSLMGIQEYEIEVVEERVGKDSSYKLDSSMLRRTMNWRDEIDLDNGLKSVISWCRDEFEFLKDCPLEFSDTSAG